MTEKNQNADLIKRIQELENELNTTKAQLNSFINNLPFVSWIKDTEGRYVYVNEPFLINFDKQAEEVLNNTDDSILDPSYVQKEISEDRQVKKSGKKMLFTGKSGDQWYETYKTPVTDCNGNV
ncbi:MAG: PAS domain-containing protein [Bacteroidales bacterium]|nr:PAS domain-containing protein [Bacteroidales bacterium]